MFCPQCGSRLQNGYCPRCRIIYQLNVMGTKSVVQRRKCPKCRAGEMILVEERRIGLLLPPVGVKSKIFRCTLCGYETSDRDMGGMLSDENFEQIKKDLKIDEMKRKIKKFVNERL